MAYHALPVDVDNPVSSGLGVDIACATYQDRRSSSVGISDGSILPVIISDFITSARLRKAVRRDWPG